ncbi:MAG: peptidoglycan-binding protein [Burkholderiaceae bacterium]|nr:peptidoglycan-binding protein [Burkholderiaceae bacterium]
MSRFIKGLSSLVNGHGGPSVDRDTRTDATDSQTAPSTLTTPLFPLNGSDADAPAPAPLPAPPVTHKEARRSSSSRALNAVVRATHQVALSTTHVEPTPPPKVARIGQRSTVVLTETEKLRLQIMQVQIKLTRLGLYEGSVDGLMHPELVEGVRHFQTLKGMRDTGMLTAGTLTALGIRAID